jgi:hypothetical protein
MQTTIIYINLVAMILTEEFRIQEPESRMGSVRVNRESRFRASDFKTLVDSLTLRYRGEEKILILSVTPDLTAGVF